MIETPFERLPESVKEQVKIELAKIEGKYSYLMSDVATMWEAWHKYKLGAKQSIGCASCYRYVVSKYRHWTA